MIIETITSRQNLLVKRFVAVRDRHQKDLIFIEGIRLAEEAIKTGLHIEAVAYTEDLFEQNKGREVIEKLQKIRCRGAIFTSELMHYVSGVESSQGIAMLATRPHYEFSQVVFPRPPLLILADGIQDPGNLGAVVRTAEAAGATGVIVTNHTVDPFNVKAIRASAGSLFRTPILTSQMLETVLETLCIDGIQLLIPNPRASMHFAQYNWNQPTAIWLGSEGSGLSSEVSKIANVEVFIPMLGAVESLNITVATSILLYEAAHQRARLH